MRSRRMRCRMQGIRSKTDIISHSIVANSKFKIKNEAVTTTDKIKGFIRRGVHCTSGKTKEMSEKLWKKKA